MKDDDDDDNFLSSSVLSKILIAKLNVEIKVSNKLCSLKPVHLLIKFYVCFD